MKKTMYFILILTLFVSAAGCGNKENSTSGGSITNEPITLTLFQQTAYLTDQEFEEMIAGPVKKKYPNISMQLIRSGKDTTKEDLVAAGNFPDLIFTAHSVLLSFDELHLLTDLNDLVKQNKFDLNMFEPTLIEEIKLSGDKGQLYALPFAENFSALFYNKDLFDKYGVSYPEDQMTLDHIMNLSKQLAEKSSGEMIAFNGGDINQFASPLSIPYVHYETGQAALSTTHWKNAFELLKSFHDLPGNTYMSPGDAAKAFGEGKIAMLAAFGARVGELEKLHNDGVTMKWDLVSYPSFPEAPGKRRAADIHTLSISSTSKHKEIAFRAISAIYEKQNQINMSRNGRFTALKDQNVKKQFGADLKSMAGKNAAGIYKVTPAPSIPFSKYTPFARSKLGAAFNKFLQGEADVNTILREAEELANQDIAVEKNKQ